MRFLSCQNVNLSLRALMRSKVKYPQECVRMSDVKGDSRAWSCVGKVNGRKCVRKCAKGSDITMPVWIVVITPGT